MPGKGFQLIGHDSPQGYPSPVVPIGIIQDRLVAIYASDRATEIYLDEGEQQFTRHNEFLKNLLKEFDYENHRLFGFSKQGVGLYSIDNESDYFRGLLKNPGFSKENPFIRLSLAKATGDGPLVMHEIALCAIHLQSTAPSFTNTWYEKQRQMLTGRSESVSDLFLPDAWQDLMDILSPDYANSSRETLLDETQASSVISRKNVQRLTDIELVDNFLVSQKNNPAEADIYFEAIFQRYRDLIRRAIGRYTYPLARWESSEDIVSKVIANLYKSLPNWRRMGQLSSYIWGIARNEVRSAGRRGIETRRNPSIDALIEEGIWGVENEEYYEPSTEGAGEELRLMLAELRHAICRDQIDARIFDEAFLNERSVDDISFRVGLSKPTVYRRIRQLRRRSAGWLYEPDRK